jgi:hypothetical protein
VETILRVAAELRRYLIVFFQKPFSLEHLLENWNICKITNDIMFHCRFSSMRMKSPVNAKTPKMGTRR